MVVKAYISWKWTEVSEKGSQKRSSVWSSKYQDSLPGFPLPQAEAPTSDSCAFLGTWSTNSFSSSTGLLFTMGTVPLCMHLLYLAIRWWNASLVRLLKWTVGTFLSHCSCCLPKLWECYRIKPALLLTS